jgi:PKD repeat protein
MYVAGGTYTITLTVTNAGGTDTVSHTDYITVVAVQEPVASFTSNITTGSAPLAVAFTDTSTNSPTSWEWSFGDDSYSTSENPTHSYTEEGNYTVALTAINYGGSDTITKTAYIMVEADEEPVASFTSNVTYGTAPLAVAFTDTSTNSPTYWKWSFGDGDVSYLENPEHSYTDAGDYSVTLTVANDAGSDKVSETSYITVESEPVASFTSDLTTGTAPLAVTFTDTSTNSPTYWKWTFGDGDVSYLENPTHTYTSSGYYTVILTTSNDAGSDTVTKSLYITVNATETTVAKTYTTVATKIATPKTTPPVTLAPASAITTAAADSATDEQSPLSLLIPGGIALVIISIIVLVLVKRGRDRPPKWDL